MDVYIRVNRSNVVEFIHHNPFHPSEGLGMSREELESQGKFVDSIPEPNITLSNLVTLNYFLIFCLF